jgi:hypothetical protein
VRGAQIREEIEQRHAREIAEEVARLQDKVDSERKTRFVSSQSGQHPAVLKMALEIQQVSTESLKFNRGFKKGPWNANATGVSTGPLKFNRGFNRALKIQQGFQQGP